MDGSHGLAFAGGAIVGLLVAWFFYQTTLVLPSPQLSGATCAAGRVQVNGSAAATCQGLTLAQLYTYVYTNLSTIPPNQPPSGAVAQPPTFPITLPAVGSSGLVAVWALYQGYSLPNSTPYTCSGGGSSGPPAPTGMSRPLSGAGGEQFEAVPRAYRVSPGSPLAGAGGGPAADLVGALSREREALLVYAPEASTPVAPVWQARGGPGPAVGWSLNLLHRHGGLGAVLSVTCAVGGREVRFTWVTNDWRFDTANRLTSEVGEPGVPTLLVRPA